MCSTIRNNIYLLRKTKYVTLWPIYGDWKTRNKKMKTDAFRKWESKHENELREKKHIEKRAFQKKSKKRKRYLFSSNTMRSTLSFIQIRNDYSIFVTFA